jgi:hypothetical protein
MESYSHNAIAHSLLMVKPHAFGSNPKTALTNAIHSIDLEYVKEIPNSGIAWFQSYSN